MKTKINELRKKIVDILETVPATRNCDVLLTTKIWEKYHQGRLLKREADGKIYVALDDLKYIPREDNIKRIRAKIQNEENLFLPTFESVAKKRKLNMQEWYNWAKINNIKY